MTLGVIHQLMSRRDDCLRRRRVFVHPVTDERERHRDLFLREQLQQRLRIRGLRTVVKNERHAFRSRRRRGKRETRQRHAKKCECE